MSNKKASKLAEEFNIAQISGSDSHFSFEFGNAYTLFDGSLKKALKQKKTQSRGKTTFGPLGGLMSFLRYKFNP
ncbi:MAG: hypothetical protein MJB14_12810 [Spirochaetes bacterium]|nr:hypothetical protein [Spirochaetota bacterium]